jgi:two-component system, OmpR family, phosphate regulon sensor histidine kinase PhoR
MWIPWLIAGVGALLLLLLHFWWRRRWQAARTEAARWREANERLAEAQERDRVAAGERQSALFDSMVEGVLILDMGGRVQLVNASFRRMFRLGNDITGKTIMEALRLRELNELIEQLPARGRVTEFELEPNTIRGQTLQVNAVSLAGHQQGEAGAMLVFHDLTHLKQLEDSRKEFVANVSHELRTPLSMIKGYLETLLDGAKDDPEVAVRFLKIIEKHADRLTFLIEDLLTISKLESGQAIMNLQAVSLAEICGRVIEDLRQLADKREIQIVSRLDPRIQVEADSSRLQQVFFNLVDNAIKYGRKGGRVEITGQPTGEGLVKICVSDDGPGIPPEARERVFERFYRVDKARSREQGGTGLGLAIVKHIIQAHHGEVWVESEAGRGAGFCFTVPEHRRDHS